MSIIIIPTSFLLKSSVDDLPTFLRKRLGSAVIVNNLDLEQPPTRQDVASMSKVLKTIGEKKIFLNCLLFIGLRFFLSFSCSMEFLQRGFWVP